jgi:hypothetical protein
MKKTPQKRDEFGLIEKIDYEINDDGSIDWRAMVGSEHLYPNRGWFESRNKPVPRTAEGLGDHQLLIKLSGIKELAKLRGFTNVSYDVVKCEIDHVAIKCGITWLPNYESEGETVYFEDIGNATVHNTSNFAKKFLETIAANRAFVRCVRNFLNVHIVGADEIDSSSSKSFSNETVVDGTLPSPQNMLEKTAKSKGFQTFIDFKTFLKKACDSGSYKNPDVLEWDEYSDISAKDARTLMPILKKY